MSSIISPPQGLHLLLPAQQRSTRCHRGAPRRDTRRHRLRRVRRRAHLQPLLTPAHADRPDPERLALRAYTTESHEDNRSPWLSTYLLVSDIVATFVVRIVFAKSKSRIGIPMIRFFGKHYFFFGGAEVSIFSGLSNRIQYGTSFLYLLCILAYRYLFSPPIVIS